VRVRKLAAAVRGAASARELKLRVMDETGDAIGAGAVGLYLFGPDGNVAELHTRGVRDGFVLAYEQLGRGHDPILERMQATTAAAHDGAVFRDEDWTRSPLFRACGGPWKIRHYLCAPLVADGAVVGTLNLGRASAAHPFARADVSAATTLGRLIGARLASLDRAASSLEQHARLTAERTQVRMHAAALEDASPRLPDAEADALWDAVVARHVTPIDMFDRGDRTYVLLPAEPVRLARRPLTRREAEIVARAADGLANKAIGYELGISQNTVGAALRSARAKLGVTSRVQLVEAARRLGL
jgi:DNA-binding CsgD family transcriptional regulator/GAF domain-containing protein